MNLERLQHKREELEQALDALYSRRLDILSGEDIEQYSTGAQTVKHTALFKAASDLDAEIDRLEFELSKIEDLIAGNYSRCTHGVIRTPNGG